MRAEPFVVEYRPPDGGLPERYAVVKAATGNTASYHPDLVRAKAAAWLRNEQALIFGDDPDDEQ